jgi:hypothetical protein
MGSATAATWRSHSGEKPAGVDGLQAPRRDWPDLPPDRQEFLTFCRETLERKGAGVPFKRGADPSPFSNFRFGMPESDM